MSQTILDRATGRAYGTMVTSLLRDLAEGELQAGDRLPTERELRDLFDISINSVRRGIDLFVEEGLLKRRRGSGVYVLRSPTLPPKPTVQDTVVVHYDVWLNRYHPFYSELRRGIDAGLARFGWKKATIVDGGADPRQSGDDIVYLGGEPEVLRERLRTCAGLAGVVLAATVATSLGSACDDQVPVVVPGRHEKYPYVAYDWDDELRNAARSLLRRGATSFLVVGAAATDVAGAIQQAGRLERKRVGAVLVPRGEVNHVLFSRLAGKAYEMTRDLLAANPEVDGVIAGNDFEAQGVFDAVSELHRTGSRRFQTAALVNRESRIHTDLHYNRIVFDGYAFGNATVDLLHRRITAPERAPQRVTLSGALEEYGAG